MFEISKVQDLMNLDWTIIKSQAQTQISFFLGNANIIHSYSQLYIFDVLKKKLYIFYACLYEIN